MGFACTAGVIFWNIAGYFILTIPRIGIYDHYLTKAVHIGRDFPTLYLRIQPLLMGLAYLCPLNILLSVWTFFVLNIFKQALMDRTGFTVGMQGQAATSGEIRMLEAHGALVFLVIWSVWVARGHLKETLQKGIIRRPEQRRWYARDLPHGLAGIQRGICISHRLDDISGHATRRGTATALAVFRDLLWRDQICGSHGIRILSPPGAERRTDTENASRNSQFFSLRPDGNNGVKPRRIGRAFGSDAIDTGHSTFFSVIATSPEASFSGRMCSAHLSARRLCHSLRCPALFVLYRRRPERSLYVRLDSNAGAGRHN